MPHDFERQQQEFEQVFDNLQPNSKYKVRVNITYAATRSFLWPEWEFQTFQTTGSRKKTILHEVVYTYMYVLQ